MGSMITILVADDFKPFRDLCQLLFEAEGFRVLLATDGAEAVTVFLAERPDLVLLDIDMPNLDGFAAAEQIKRTAPSVPVVFHSSLDDERLSDPQRRLGMLIRKPAHYHVLRRAILHALQAERGVGDLMSE